jgi:hypothetical protein
MSRSILADDETSITEITLQPDGRVYVFGTSRQVLAILQNLSPKDEKLFRLLSHMQSLDVRAEEPAALTQLREA